MKNEQHAGSWAAIKEVDLDRIIRSVMHGSDSPAHRDAAAETLMYKPEYIARMDHDAEVLIDVFSAETADALSQMMWARHAMRQPHITDKAARHHEMVKAQNAMRIGLIVFDLFAKEADRLITEAVERHGMERQGEAA